jgi:hypothetical protein
VRPGDASRNTAAWWAGDVARSVVGWAVAAYNPAMNSWRALTLLLALVCARDAVAAAAAWDLPDSETLTYAVKWGRLTVVDASFSLEPRDEATGTQVLAVNAWTTAVPSRIYRVRNHYESVVDIRAGLPLAYAKECDEAKFQESSRVDYDQGSGVAVYTRVDTPTRDAPLPSKMHNLFTGLYLLRLHDFAAEPTADFHLDAKGVYWLARARRARNLRTADGDVWEVVVEFERTGGLDEPLQSDLLTDNIVHPKNPLMLHIRAKGEARPAMVVYMEYEMHGFRLKANLLEDADRDGRGSH